MKIKKKYKFIEYPLSGGNTSWVAYCDNLKLDITYLEGSIKHYIADFYGPNNYDISKRFETKTEAKRWLKKEVKLYVRQYLKN